MFNREVDTDMSGACIKALMKSECNLSYVRWKLSTNSIDTTKIILSRSLFAFDFLQAISEHTLVLNIDESVVSRNTKIKMLGMREQPKEYKNSQFQGSTSVIMAILFKWKVDNNVN